MSKIGVILIDDNRILREGITEIIEQQPDIKMMAALRKSETTLTKICDLKPDVLLLGFSLTDHKSLELIQSLKKNCPETKVIIMDVIPLQSGIVTFIKSGVSGFLLKDASTNDFLNTIRLVADSEKVLPTNLTGSLFSQIVDTEVTQLERSKLIQKVRMTKRELEMILLIADGMTNKDIAQKLHLSNYKVQRHVHNILQKMVLNTRIQFVLKAHPEDINPTAISTLSDDE